MNSRYIVFDARFEIDEESAIVLGVANTVEMAEKIAEEYGSDNVIYNNETGEIL